MHFPEPAAEAVPAQRANGISQVDGTDGGKDKADADVGEGFVDARPSETAVRRRCGSKRQSLGENGQKQSGEEKFSRQTRHSLGRVAVPSKGVKESARTTPIRCSPKGASDSQRACCAQPPTPTTS